MQTHPGLIGFSSGLLHVHISRMVIIVWYRLDQFAFNPDFGGPKRIVARRAATRRHRNEDRKRLIVVFIPSSDEINMFLFHCFTSVGAAEPV